jgi:hypothetical protein
MRSLLWLNEPATAAVVRDAVGRAFKRAADNYHAIAGIPYGPATLVQVLGREPTAAELELAREETLRLLRTDDRGASPVSNLRLLPSPVGGTRIACPQLDLGGRTVESPCTGWWCTLEEFGIVRNLFVAEHNALVRSLDQWNQAVGAGKTTWTPVPTVAYKVYEESWVVLQKYPTDYGSGWANSDIYKLSEPISAMIQQATTVHAANCDVRSALEQLGEQVPANPEPPKKGDTLAEQAIDFAKDLGGGITTIAWIGLGAVGVAALGAIGYALLSRKGGR